MGFPLLASAHQNQSSHFWGAFRRKIQMGFTLWKNDRELVAFIAQHKILTVKQLSTLSRRSCQVIRRRIRNLEKDGFITTRIQGYGRGQGRPEDIIFLTEKSSTALSIEEIPSGKTPERMEDSFSINHLLLVNWFLIHILQIKRSIPRLSIHCLSTKIPAQAQRAGDNFLTPTDNRPRNSVEFMPDGAFSITRKGEDKKTLLFFLEVDMGTETIASMDRDHKDIRQKILNYQALFRSGMYKRYENLFGTNLNGFRLLFLANSTSRLISLCRLVREMPPSDFIWLTEQGKMFSQGLAAKIWSRGGKIDDLPQSIIGPKLACELPPIDSKE